MLSYFWLRVDYPYWEGYGSLNKSNLGSGCYYFFFSAPFDLVVSSAFDFGNSEASFGSSLFGSGALPNVSQILLQILSNESRPK